jgi:hypothetical protein
MHSSVLTITVAVLGHMSASGSRGIIHRQSSVVAVARLALGLHQNRFRSRGFLDDQSVLAAHSARRLLALHCHTNELRTVLHGAAGELLWLLEAEFGAVSPHRMHYHRELACHRDAGPLAAALVGNLQPPQAAEAVKARQQMLAAS